MHTPAGLGWGWLRFPKGYTGTDGFKGINPYFLNSVCPAWNTFAQELSREFSFLTAPFTRSSSLVQIKTYSSPIQNHSGALPQGIKVFWEPNNGTTQNSSMALRSERLGIRSPSQAGGFRPPAFSNVGGGQGQAPSGQIAKNRFQ